MSSTWGSTVSCTSGRADRGEVDEPERVGRPPPRAGRRRRCPGDRWAAGRPRPCARRGRAAARGGRRRACPRRGRAGAAPASRRPRRLRTDELDPAARARRARGPGARTRPTSSSRRAACTRTSAPRRRGAWWPPTPRANSSRRPRIRPPTRRTRGAEADEPPLPGQHAALPGLAGRDGHGAEDLGRARRPAVTPWSWASGVTSSRWASTGSASALMSSGTT